MADTTDGFNRVTVGQVDTSGASQTDQVTVPGLAYNQPADFENRTLKVNDYIDIPIQGLGSGGTDYLVEYINCVCDPENSFEISYRKDPNEVWTFRLKALPIVNNNKNPSIAFTRVVTNNKTKEVKVSKDKLLFNFTIEEVTASNNKPAKPVVTSTRLDVDEGGNLEITLQNQADGSTYRAELTNTDDGTVSLIDNVITYVPPKSISTNSRKVTIKAYKILNGVESDPVNIPITVHKQIATGTAPAKPSQPRPKSVPPTEVQAGSTFTIEFTTDPDTVLSVTDVSKKGTATVQGSSVKYDVASKIDADIEVTLNIKAGLQYQETNNTTSWVYSDNYDLVFVIKKTATTTPEKPTTPGTGVEGEDVVGSTTLDVSPREYTFTNIGEATSINIETDASTFEFTRANTYGTGEVTIDKATKVITAKTYGKSKYKLSAKADGKTETVRYVQFELARPILEKAPTHTVYVPVNSGSYRFAYTAPAGYSIKSIDTVDLVNPPVTATAGSEEITFTPSTVGDVRMAVVVTKNNPAEAEKNVEFVSAYLDVRVFNLETEPDTSGIFVNLKQVFKFETVKVTMGQNSEAVPLKFKAEYGEVKDSFTLESTDLGNDSYFVSVTGVKPGEGMIKILTEDDVELTQISVSVEDHRVLTLDPNVDEVTIKYKESYTFKEISYDNNGSPDEVQVIPSSKTPPFDMEFKKTDEAKIKYTLKLTNKADRGGESNLTVKSVNSTIGSKTVKVKCLKEVKKGTITLEPSLNVVTINAGRTQTYQYVSATDSDDIIAVNPNPNVAAVRFEEVKGQITKPDTTGAQVPVQFPAFSKQYIVYIVGVAEGEIEVTIKGIVNTDDVTSEQKIKVKVLPNDQLPNEMSMVNLYAPILEKDRKGDIVIDLPEDSATLALKETLDASIVIEFGYSYDYVQAGIPRSNTNPKAYSTTSGNPTWLNTLTNELFVCVDSTGDKNIWMGNKGTWVNKIVYPNPGEKGFGVGPAPTNLAKYYNLTECDGCWDRNSDNYGNYYDANYTKFVFIPMHYIVPKANTELANKYPYDGMEYKFSWNGGGEFTTKHIPRCFINKGVAQLGIFVTKYNNESALDGYNEINPGTRKEFKVANSNSTSLYPLYKTGSAINKAGHSTFFDTMTFPELRAMSRVTVPTPSTSTNALGRHNMTIFIQTMIANLGDLHTIASYEKNATEDVCGKLKYLVSGTWTREVETIQGTGNEKQVYKASKIFKTGDGVQKTEYISFDNGTGSVIGKYRKLYSHNGQECGVFDVNGPANTPLPGILVVQDNVDNPNDYKVYALKDTLDISEIDKTTFVAAGQSNTESLVLKTPLFNLDNYTQIAEIRNNENMNKMLHYNTTSPYYTHRGDTSGLDGTVSEYNNINAGLSIDTVLDFSVGQYAEEYSSTYDKGYRESKFKNSVFNLGFLDKIDALKIRNKKWYGMFTANYIPTSTEATNGKFKIDGVYNGYRTRVVHYVGMMRYLKKNSSEYMLGSRTCITPNIVNNTTLPDEPGIVPVIKEKEK